MQSTLERLVELIRANPTMTAKELARALGYAQPRSLYHWLEKAGYSGVRSFRDAVLRGEYPPFAAPAAHLKLQESVASPPLLQGFLESGVPELSGDAASWPDSAEFALKWPGPRRPPIAWGGDLLLLQRSEKYADGDWLVLRTAEGRYDIARLAIVEGKRLAIRPPYGEVIGEPLPHVLARIIASLRLFT